MSRRKDIPPNHPYHYNKQLQESMDADFEALKKEEKRKHEADKREERSKERIEARKSAEYTEQQNKRNYSLSLWSFIVAVMALIISMISLFKG